MMCCPARLRAARRGPRAGARRTRRRPSRAPAREATRAGGPSTARSPSPPRAPRSGRGRPAVAFDRPREGGGDERPKTRDRKREQRDEWGRASACFDDGMSVNDARRGSSCALPSGGAVAPVGAWLGPRERRGRALGGGVRGEDGGGEGDGAEAPKSSGKPLVVCVEYFAGWCFA